MMLPSVRFQGIYRVTSYNENAVEQKLDEIKAQSKVALKPLDFWPKQDYTHHVLTQNVILTDDDCHGFLKRLGIQSDPADTQADIEQKVDTFFPPQMTEVLKKVLYRQVPSDSFPEAQQVALQDHLNKAHQYGQTFNDYLKLQELLDPTRIIDIKI